MHYYSLGQVPAKRHTQFRKPNGELYHEELFSTEGFSDLSSLLYHCNAPTQIVQVGDPFSVAPEIVEDKQLKHRSLKGFDVNPEDDPLSAQRIVDAAFSAPRAIRKTVPEVAPGVARAIERGLEKEPAARFKDCATFARALQLDESTGTRRSFFGAEQRRTLLRLGVLVLILLLGVAGYVHRQRIEERLPMIRQVMRGGNDVETARSAAEQAIASGFATEIWKQAEDNGPAGQC